VISPTSNLFNCFGCGAGGSVIDWVMKTQGVSFRHAVELLKHDVAAVTSSLAASSESPVKKTTVPKLAAPVSLDADDQTLLREVVDYYHETLMDSMEGIAYLEARGLADGGLIKHFKLGYANRTLGLRLPQKKRKTGAELREKLQRVGVYRESGHEHLNGSLVVPLFNAAGDVVQLYGRKILDNLRAGTAYHLYLAGDHAGVFNYAGLVGCEEIILCEALLDALTFWRWGFRNVTSSYGVNGFTNEILQALIELKIKRVYIAYDRDDAGNVAAEKVAKQLNENGMDAFRVLFPKGMDANEYAFKVVPAPKSLELVLRKAEWLGNGVNKNDPVEIQSEIIEPPKDVAQKTETTSPLAAEKIPSSNVTTEVSENEINLIVEARHYRVRGLNKNTSHELLKINMLVKVDNNFYVDTLDLYSAKARAIYVKQAALELGVDESILKSDLGVVLLQLEEIQDQLIRGVLGKSEKRPVMSDDELHAALGLLKSSTLMQQVLADFARCGVVGEEANKQVAYLAAVSRKLDRPLAVMVQSSSAAGKSSLMEAVLKFMPEEERIQYSAMTGQSLFYLGEKDLKHKILAISEEEGAHSASYALKLLQSEGVVSIASTGKNATTGNLETQEYRVEGPVMLFSTTTAIDLDEELLNRCLVLSVDESREQTQLIHAQQRKRRTLEGLKTSEDKQRLITLHQNAQRLLRPLKVVNPYAEHLTFLSDKTRTRRDHEKYLALIDAITLLHQYQREVKRVEHDGAVIEYIEVTLDDIELANQLAHEVLGRTLDELPPQTRKLLTLISEMVKGDCAQLKIKASEYRFTRKQVREFCGWSDGQLKIHCVRLEELEYLLVHKGSRGRSIEYELLFDGDASTQSLHLMGLIDTATLKINQYDGEKLGKKAKKLAPSQGQVSPKLGPSQGVEITKYTEKNSSQIDLVEEINKNAHLGKLNGGSYRTGSSSSLAANTHSSHTMEL
jgi:DNA primase